MPLSAGDLTSNALLGTSPVWKAGQRIGAREAFQLLEPLVRRFTAVVSAASRRPSAVRGETQR